MDVIVATRSRRNWCSHPRVRSTTQRTQPAAVFRAPPGQGRRDVTSAQFLAMPPRVIGSVQPLGSAIGAPAPLTSQQLVLGGQDGRLGLGEPLRPVFFPAAQLAPGTNVQTLVESGIVPWSAPACCQ